ncbi:MAG: hypothetical protein KTR16_16210 [Acidiferrobacterales bacterium]|nr:hypothetical protein [Acidiferrobacterales bacterium]
MKNGNYYLGLLTSLALLLTSTANAVNFEDNEESGDLGVDETDIGLSEFSGWADRDRKPKVHIVDQAYELGKSVYKGRQDGIPKLSYCITAEGEQKRLKRRLIKSYKSTTFSNLASNLYNCDIPGKRIKSDLPRDEFLHVLYYLDKRYKLNLRRE